MVSPRSIDCGNWDSLKGEVRAAKKPCFVVKVKKGAPLLGCKLIHMHSSRK